MDLTIRLPDGVHTVPAEEVTAKAKEIAAACPSEITNVYRVWYEGFDGCGVPNADTVAAIEKGILENSNWEPAGKVRFEKYGVVEAYRNKDYANAPKDKDGNIMPLHMFHLGSHYQGPDGKVYWLAVIEKFDMRCFERVDGKYVGEMVEIDPTSDYARQMVEVK